jgi:hypothetical protein
MQKHHHSPLMAATTTLAALECEGALSDLVLQAAREAIPADADKLLTLPWVGERNQPLMPLLVGLIESTKATANALADNAWDSGQAIPKGVAAGLINDLRDAMQFLQQSTEAF